MNVVIEVRYPPALELIMFYILVLGFLVYVWIRHLKLKAKDKKHKKLRKVFTWIERHRST